VLYKGGLTEDGVCCGVLCKGGLTEAGVCCVLCNGGLAELVY